MILGPLLGFSYPEIMTHLASQLFHKQRNQQATNNLDGGWGWGWGVIFIH